MKQFKNKKSFSRFLSEIDRMSESDLIEMSDGIITDTPGFWASEPEQRKLYEDIEDYFLQCLGSREFSSIREFWEQKVKK
jgi:hypothetical protein